MPIDDVQQLIEQGERSGLFAAADVQSIVAQTKTDGPLTADAIAAQLIEKSVLTRFQADKLLAGTGHECLIAERYQILDKLGAGGMGTVYKAHDTQLDRDVAVKVLPPERLHDADAVARFRREARALAKLSHPNIIQAYDSGADQGRQFLVMEYVPGASLAAILRDGGSVAPPLAADMIYQAALGLQHAHEKHLVHRDLKPGNLLLAGAGLGSRESGAREPGLPANEGAVVTTSYVVPVAVGKGIVKILDLGLARFFQDQLGEARVTQEGIGIGTPDYMAPEQFRDALHADARTDIYGLGCTLYELISGTVPFPGSSFREKAEAHAKKQPLPLEERCPEVPAGLAFVVSKMMAKHPSDRYQTAAEVAEALAPHVAGASHSMILLRQTGRFNVGAATMSGASRRKRLVAVAGIGGAVCLAVALMIAWPAIFPKRSAASSENGSSSQVIAANSSEPGSSSSESTKPKIVTIANGLTVAQDGTGQYTTIGAALDDARPGQTIRVLDSAIYREALVLSGAKHSNITLEAPQHAVLEFANEGGIGILVAGAADVTIRGFHCQADAAKIQVISIKGHCPGVTLQELSMNSLTSAAGYNGIIIRDLELKTGEAPVVIEGCAFRQAKIGIGVVAIIESDYSIAVPCTRIAIRGNTIISPSGYGILVRGAARQIQVVGNRIWGATQWSALQLDHLFDAEDILVANNTIFECAPAFRLWDYTVSGKNIQIRNNLCLGMSELDMLFLHVGASSPASTEPGEGKLVGDSWQLDHNYREVKPPNGSGGLAPAWIPPTAADVVTPDVAVLSRDPKDLNFLRPAQNSPLANGGAGGDLLSYVGALAPEGAEAWNWQWTWDAMIEKRLTVSKETQTGGRFRTIGAALKLVKPHMTIRVLDAEKYAEPLVIDDARAYEGLTLEAPQHATVVLSEDFPQAMLIKGVTNFQARGFHFEDTGPAKPVVFFVRVEAGCQGLVLEDLDCKSKNNVSGVLIINSALPADAKPVVVRKCHIQVQSNGILMSGLAGTPVRGALITDNHVTGDIGIVIQYAVKDVIVAGNVVTNCEQAGVQIDDPLPAMQGVLVANNTIVNCKTAVRIWRTGAEDKFEKGQVEFRGNVLMTSQGGDMLFFRQAPGEKLGSPQKSDTLLDLWGFGQNYRDRIGSQAELMIPLAKDDRKLEPAWFLSRIATDPDFLRPKADSPLATGGAGGDLPAYAGAIPPDGKPWDWTKTWKARMEKRKSSGSDQ